MKKHPEISDCMKRRVISVSMDTSIGEAATLIVQQKVGTLPVLDQYGMLVGLTTTLNVMQNFLPNFVSLLTNIDFVKDFGMLEAPSQERLEKVGSLSIADIMGPPVGVEGNSSLIKSLSIMEKHNLWDLPVLEGGKLIGIASRVDIARAFFLEWQIPQIDTARRRG